MDCPVMCVWSLEWSQPVSLQHLILKWSVAYKSKRGSKEDDDTPVVVFYIPPSGCRCWSAVCLASGAVLGAETSPQTETCCWGSMSISEHWLRVEMIVLQIFQLSWTFSAFSGWSFPCALLLQLWIQSMSKEHFSICSKPTTTPKVFPSCQPARRTHYSSP